MKRYFIFIFILCISLIGNAQNYVTPDIGKLHPKRNAKNRIQVSRQEDKTNPSNVQPNETVIDSVSIKRNEVAMSGYKLLCDAIENAIVVVKQKYNVRQNGINVSGNNFFGESYSIFPILKYGYGIDSRYNKPWEYDARVAQYKDCSDCMFSVDVRQYRRLSDKNYKEIFDLQTEITDTIASGIYFIRDSFMHNKGMNIVTGNGIRTGYMVWFRHIGNGVVTYEIIPMSLTYNENFIFPIAQPKQKEQVFGGMFIQLNASVPGCIKVDLMGMARLDPYGKKNWELVKPLMIPTPPQPVVKEENVEKDKDKSSAKAEKKVEKEDAIIPDNSSGEKVPKSGKKNKTTK